MSVIINTICWKVFLPFKETPIMFMQNYIDNSWWVFHFAEILYSVLSWLVESDLIELLWILWAFFCIWRDQKVHLNHADRKINLDREVWKCWLTGEVDFCCPLVDCYCMKNLVLGLGIELLNLSFLGSFIAFYIQALYSLRLYRYPV